MTRGRDPHRPASLAERARAAANRTGHADPAWDNTRWVTRAQHIAARLALILADLGDLLSGDTETEPTSAFDHDPGHAPDCLHAAPAPEP